MNVELSHVTGPMNVPLVDFTVGELLTRASLEAPNHEALISCQQGIRMTFRDLDEASNRLARGLLELGLEPGDRVGIWSPNNAEWIITLFAVARLGLILVNVNPAYRPRELEYALNKVGCRALIMADQFKTSIYPDIVADLAPEVANCERGRLASKALPSLEVLIVIGEEDRRGFLEFDEVIGIGGQSDLTLRSFEGACDIHSPVNIQFTSGTTGSPKGATLTHHNVVNNAYFTGLGLALTKRDRLCMPVPLYHCFGMVLGVLACVAHRAALVLPDLSFDPVTTLQAVASEQCTALYGVPTMFSGILDHPDFASDSVKTLRTGIVAGSLCPKVLMCRILEELHMSEVTNCYGMTETSPVSFQTGIDDNLEKRATTVGRVHPHVEVKIIDTNGKTVPRGSRGEICTKGYNVMRSYWADEEKTRESIVDGWMLTGDEGVIDEDGYCAVVGRIKDTIIRGGENIAPKEIEEFLVTHGEILEVQAFGIPDEKYGEIVCVWIKKAPGSGLSEDSVKAFCREQIAHYKIPAIVRFVEEYPLTVTGKVQKYVMRQEMQNELQAGSRQSSIA